MQSTAKVGLLLVVFVGLLIAGYAVLGRNLLAPKPDIYYVEVSDAGGLSDGAPVLMAGVQIGTLTHVALKTPTLARLTLSLNHGTRIPSGSTAVLPTSFIGFGENPVTIVPPSATGSPSTISPGQTLPGVKTSALDGILPDSKKTVAELTRTMAAVRKLLEDQKMQTKISDLLITSNRTIDRFGVLARDASRLIAQNQSNIGKAMTAATAAIEDVHRVTAKVAELMQNGKLQSGAEQILNRIKTITEHTNDLIVSMNQLVNDPKLRDPMSRTASNIADITNTGKSIAGNTAEMTKNGVAITANAAIVSKKAIVLTDKATEIATKATEIEDQLKGVLDKVGGFFNKAPSSKDIPKITTEMDLMRQTKPGYWRTDVDFSFPMSDSTLHFGLFDALESNKFTVELAKPVNQRFSYRYGIYASTPSIGVDYLLAPRWSLRGDAWSINDPRLDLRASYEIGNGLIGWFGVDRTLKENALTFGIGVRR
ncbi:MAG: MlaD family protein [Fimbriimonas sp.]|nr:MlaD family protein [Fimbriimonas sp.]